jgi:hypothetical protein
LRRGCADGMPPCRSVPSSWGGLQHSTWQHPGASTSSLCIASQQPLSISPNKHSHTCMHWLPRTAVSIGLICLSKKNITYASKYSCTQPWVYTKPRPRQLQNLLNKMSAYHAIQPLREMLHHKRKAVLW